MRIEAPLAGGDYRSAIFGAYRTVQGLPPTRGPATGRPRANVYRTYLRGWLPAAPDARILEIGCGAGDLLSLLASQGYKDVTGVDISPEQIAVARQVHSQVLLGDGLGYLTSHPATFELVIAVDVLEHLPKALVVDFLGAARAALVPGGRLILQIPNCASPWGVVQRYSDFTHEVGLTPGALDWLLRLTGFTEAQFRETGPVVHGIRSLVRWVSWRVVRWALVAFDLVETGSAQPVYTRVFLASAVNPAASSSQRGAGSHP